MPRSRKRQLYVEAEPATDSSPPPIAKRRKLEKQQRHRTPSWFWDNLSRQWLTPRTLREFDRRTEWPATPLPPDRTGKEDIDLAQLKRFARHGGPSLGHLRANPKPPKRARTRRESEISSKTKKSSAYDPAFEQHLIDHGIYPHGYDYDDDDGSVYPDNWEEINERLAQPRPSLSPSRFPREAFRKFEKTNMQALTENTVMSKAFPIIAGTANIPSQENLLFGNLKHLTDGSITKARPDCYDGSRPTDLNKQIREELGPYIVPSTNTAAPCLPNFFTEGKGPSGNTAVCKRQALYDGALGARGMHELRSYVDPGTAYDNNAYTITSTYHGGSGDLTIYPTPSNDPQNPIEYRMTQLNGWKMTGNPEAFRQGTSALRNARDWAKEKREELMIAANGKVPDAEHSDLVSSTQSFVSLSSTEDTHPESEISTDELALDAGTFTSSSHRTPVRAQTNLPPKVSPNRQSMKASQVKKRPSRRPEVQSTMQSSSAPSGYQDPAQPLDSPSCLFLTALAREIRFQIYNHFLLQYNLIHIVQPFTRKGLLSRRCALEVPDIDPRPGHSSSPSPDLDDSDEPPLVYEGNKQVIQDRRWCPFERAYELPRYDTRAVLLTCRTTYEEIAPIFYRGVTWSMCDPLALFRLESTIHPSYFQSIQHIQFSHAYYALGWDGSTFGPSSPRSEREQVLGNIKRERWGDFWHILAGLHALKSLKV